MGGDTGKIIGYTALAVAAVYTGGAAMGMWGAGAKAGSLAGTGIGKAGVGFGKAGAGTGFAKGATVSNTGTGFGFASGGGFAPGTVPMATNVGTTAGGMPSLGSLGGSALPSLGTVSGVGGGSSMVANTPALGLVKQASYNLAAPSITNTALNTAPTLSSLGSLNAPDPTFLGKMGNAMSGVGNYVAENPLSSYLLGSGAINQMTAPSVGDYPMADYSTLANMKTYDQGLGHMTIEELTAEMGKPGLTADQRNSIARAMEMKGLDQDRIYEARVRASLGDQRYADVNQAVQKFNEDTNISNDDLDEKTAVILANLNAQTDPQYKKAESQLNQKWAQIGRFYSRGHDDAFSGIAEAQARTHQDNMQKAETMALARNKDMQAMRQQGVNAILAGANYGDTLDRYKANLDENNRRYLGGRLLSDRDSNYSTALLGLQGINNANLGRFKADQASANAQALQGLEMTRMGLRGYSDLVPLGRRSLYDSAYTGYMI